MNPSTFELTVDDARTFLTGHPGPDVTEVEYVGEGAWSRCFGFRSEGRDLVVRFGKHRDDFEKDCRAATFATPDLPVPQVVEIGEAFDGWFVVSTRAIGKPLESLETTADWERVLPSLFAALDTMREGVDLSGCDGWGGWGADGRGGQASWRERLRSVAQDTPEMRTHGWSERLRDLSGGDALFRRAYAQMDELASRLDVPKGLIHGDLINRNVLVHEGRLSALFDWGCSAYGDSLYDVAWLEFWAPWYPALEAVGIRERYVAHCAAIGAQLPFLEERLRLCHLHIGLDHLAYNAFTEDEAALLDVDRRMRALLD